MTVATGERLAASWVWQRKPLVQMTADSMAARAQRDALAGKDRDLQMARVMADLALDGLHDQTVLAVRMARNLYRHDEIVLGSLTTLSADGKSRQDTLNEALAWLKAWERLPDADWTPLPAVTQESFAALLTDAETKHRALATAMAEEREARRDFNQVLADLWTDCVDWYADATVVFPEGTPDGQLVRAILTRHAPSGGGAPQPPTV
jgi:hypothetical protein